MPTAVALGSIVLEPVVPTAFGIQGSMTASGSRTGSGPTRSRAGPSAGSHGAFRGYARTGGV
jgi:hypothetical protein